ncbi:MAG: sigma-54-dependent Fis family transcriptional regulator [Phycisphaerae bacterium]|nr:sigma-54-dependent Fis family transcriptional regulator [Phycisphaerae bacterium]
MADALEPLARQVFRAEDTQAALACARAERPDLFLVAERGAGSAGGVEVVIGLSTCEAPVVVLAEQPSVDWAVQYVRHGAYDYVAGDLDEDMLGRLVTGIRGCGDGGDDARDHCFCDECPAGVPFVGRSEATVKVLETIRLVAESRCNPILIVGETGTGKELAARAVHAWRCGDPEQFVAVNCAALTATLLESELFGHVKGAFTGADRDKAGLFELAGRGTLFLDEISEMSPELQAKLLRVLQERSFRKVGGTRDIACEATIIASSNRDLLAASRSAKFRQDLYYRLAVFPIRLAPLRDPSRRSDISMLAEYFLRTSSLGGPEASLTPEAEGELTGHTWPGNVRELRNVLERALLLARGGQITPQELRIERVDAAPADSARASAAKKKDFSLETAEREFIIRALRETGWQRTRAAALLGITRATLHAKLKRYGIQPPDSAHCGRGQVGESSGACRRRQPQRADK